MGANPEATFDGLLTNASFWAPEHLSESAWLEHAPFAFWLIQACQPRSFVELGTHSGFSYFAVCQTVGRLDLGTRCYAVDTWQGDEHAGFYGEDVFQAVSKTNEQHFAGFSQLIRGTFDSARPEFLDGSIDVLHIDGRHYYEDVRHDVDTWMSALSPRGVLLLHDIEVRERSFGVHRLWAELREQYRTFSFVHGHGLGVVAVGSEVPPKVADLVGLEADGRTAIFLRIGYARLGEAVRETLTTRRLHGELAAREAETDERQRLRQSVVDLRGQVAAGEQAIRVQAEETRRLAAELIVIRSSRLLRFSAALADARSAVSAFTHAAYRSLTAPFRRKRSRRTLSRPSQSGPGDRQSFDFDPDFYLSRYPDVASSRIGPLEHYMAHGRHEGRLAMPPKPTAAALNNFDPAFYLTQYPDVAQAGMDPLDHWVEYGMAEGRMAHAPASAEGVLPEFRLPAEADRHRPSSR